MHTPDEKTSKARRAQGKEPRRTEEGEPLLPVVSCLLPAASLSDRREEGEQARGGKDRTGRTDEDAREQTFGVSLA